MQVDVVVRVRPLLRHESQQPMTVRTTSGVEQKPSILTLLPPDADPIDYNFDKCRDESVTLSTLFQQDIAPAVNGLFAGKHATVVTYGAMGAGKTFTMEGNEQSVGIIPRCIRRLYRVVEEQKYDCEIAVTYVDIDGGEVQDLLASEDDKTAMSEQGLAKICVSNAVEFKKLYDRGGAARKIATNQAISTRRHSILTVHVRAEGRRNGAMHNGKLHLIELTGGDHGLRVETGENNSSLFVLDNVISSLRATSDRFHSRERILAQLLQDSLRGNSHVVLICNISPSRDMHHETLNTLNYAHKIQSIFSKAVKDISTPMIKTPVPSSLFQKSSITPSLIGSKVDNIQMKKRADKILKVTKARKIKTYSFVPLPEQKVSVLSEIVGKNDNVELTMEEKLDRWKLAKQAKQKIVHSTRSRISVTRRDLRGSASSGGLKRKFDDVGRVSKTIINRPPDMMHTSLSVPKKSRYSELISDKIAESPKPVIPRFNIMTKPKPVPTNGTEPPTSAPLSRIQTGSAQHPIIIEDVSDTTTTVRQYLPISNVVVKKGSLVPKESDRNVPNSTATSLPNLSFIAQKRSASISSEYTHTTLDQRLPKQSPDTKKSTPGLIQNEREAPIAKKPELCTVTTKEQVKPKSIWSGHPTLDKENQTVVSSLPSQKQLAQVMTLENKPEMLAKDFIKIAISFEKKSRITTAFSIFKRAHHVLPEKSAKLSERLIRLECEHPAVAGQVPSQAMSTAAFMAKVLERDLVSVLNNGSTKELTELHAIGDKRAELILDQRPFQKLEELQRVSGISPNTIAKLYEYHTNWKNHQ